VEREGLGFEVISDREVEGPMVEKVSGLPGARIEGLRTIMSHPMALNQCSRFLESMTAVRVVHHGFDDPPALARTAATREEALAQYRRRASC